MATNQHTASRRGMLGLLAAAPMMALPVAASASHGAALMAQAVAINDEGVRMDDLDLSQEQWDAWSERLSQVYTEIKALPMTVENARVRAVAAVALQGEEGFEDMFYGESTTSRLIVQILQSLGSH